jgi:hypothetical protein
VAANTFPRGRMLVRAGGVSWATVPVLMAAFTMLGKWGRDERGCEAHHALRSQVSACNTQGAARTPTMLMLLRPSCQLVSASCEAFRRKRGRLPQRARAAPLGRRWAAARACVARSPL